MDLCSLTVQSDGSTRCTWKDSGESAQVNIETRECRGKCSISRSKTKSGMCLYYEEAAAICVTGANQDHVCKLCMCRIVGKAKARNDFPRITYCSVDCLASAYEYLDFCGPFLVELTRMKPEWRNVAHILAMAIQFLYSVYSANSANSLAKFLSILKLESHEQHECAELEDPTKWLLHVLRAKLTVDQACRLSMRGIKLMEDGEDVHSAQSRAGRLISTLLRVIKYNAQPLSVYGLQQVQLLALLPSAARLNHSCRPNCALVHRVLRQAPQHLDEAVHCAVVVSVVAIRELAPGEELTVSYLQPLCAPMAMRRSLLQQGFAFTCRCERCISGDMASNKATMVVMNALEKELQRTTSTTGGALPLAALMSLMHLAENTLREGLLHRDVHHSDVVVATVHDAASLVLQQATLQLKQAPQQHQQQSGWQTLQLLSVRAQLALAACWAGVGCGSCIQRMEFAIKASQTLAEVVKNTTPPLVAAGDAPSSWAELRVNARRELQESMELLQEVYISTNSIGETAESATAISSGALSTCEYIGSLNTIGSKLLEFL